MQIRWIVGLIAMAVIMALAMWVYSNPGGQRTQQFTDLPWQVQVIDEQRTRVLGFTLGESTMADQMGRLPVPDIRLFVDPDGSRSVEAYYVNARIPPFETNLVLRPDLDEAELDRIESQTTSDRPMPSGAWRYGLSDEALSSLGNVPIVEMSYIPRARWTPDVLEERFGEPAERMQVDSDHSYWLYPDRGLAIMVPRRGRVLMHYVTQERWGETMNRLRDEGRRMIGEDHE
ncbi:MULTISPECIES: hypothetical protein [unclassified Thioalkalivibrio]|uniref:hypothetical protein n=1 Tax=unclassified Thioalkalivibrio TaxID=2621013 RepID=UPI00036D5380|nr:MULTISPECIES: hypothetical protein [unclassified Thioalkalivibrio]